MHSPLNPLSRERGLHGVNGVSDGNGRRLANAFRTAGNKYYYHNDMLGSVRRLVRQNQTFVYERDYYPYGSDRRAAGATHLPSPEHFKFTGKNQDVEFSLYYFGARYYDPELGRWTQPDPLADRYPGWSPYVYALDNPLRYVDPDGEKVINPQGQVIGNVRMEEALILLNREVMRVTGLTNDQFNIEITGGDRTIGEGGKHIEIGGTGGWIEDSKEGSDHLASKGGTAIDISTKPGKIGNKLVSKDLLEEAARDVGLYPSGEYPTHLHLELPNSAAEAEYREENKPFQEDEEIE